MGFLPVLFYTRAASYRGLLGQNELMTGGRITKLNVRRILRGSTLITIFIVRDMKLRAASDRYEGAPSLQVNIRRPMIVSFLSQYYLGVRYGVKRVRLIRYLYGLDAGFPRVKAFFILANVFTRVRGEPPAKILLVAERGQTANLFYRALYRNYEATSMRVGKLTVLGQRLLADNLPAVILRALRSFRATNNRCLLISRWYGPILCAGHEDVIRQPPLYYQDVKLSYDMNSTSMGTRVGDHNTRFLVYVADVNGLTSRRASRSTVLFGFYASLVVRNGRVARVIDMNALFRPVIAARFVYGNFCLAMFVSMVLLQMA